MIEALRNAWRLQDLRKKILFTIFILLIYQFAAHVPVPGVNREALQNLVAASGGGGIIGVLDLLSGGAVSNFSVIANGVYPYITANIIITLIVPIFPRLEAIVKEPGGQDKVNQWTYYLAIPMSMLQSVSQIQTFEQLSRQQGGQQIIPAFGSDLLSTATIIITMTAGTMFAIWLGELITEQGIGQGISVIIFAGIVARVPNNFIRLFGGDILFNIASFFVLTVVTVLVIVVVQEGVRRIPVQYGKRVRGRKLYGGGSTHIPLRVNTAGMIPLIFAQALMAFPSVVVAFLPAGGVTDALRSAIGTNSDFGQQTGLLYWFLYFLLVVGFTYFYTDVMVQNQNLAENLQKQGGFIPGIRPGRRTQEYITRVVRRITLVGSLFLGAVAVLPGIMQLASGIFGVAGGGINPAYVISGSGLIIVVGVVIDTMRQLEAQLVMRNYEGFMR
ncbi:MAG: preprotein translocase subunit SecY [Anaerolineae bacterium]|nr:preprotein translocase subunit SecY [Anaerolineae bacterium]